MKKTVKRGIEVLRSPKPCYSKGQDELYRKLTVLASRKSGIELQLKSYGERIDALTEILQKVRQEELELTSLLRPGTNYRADNGGDKKQCILPKTLRTKGKEMVFRF